MLKVTEWSLFMSIDDLIVLLLVPSLGTFFVHLHKKYYGNDIVLYRTRHLLVGLN